MKTFNFRYVTPVVVCRTITQAQKDQSAERRAKQRARRCLMGGK